MEIQLRIHHREYLPFLYDSHLFPSSFLRHVLLVSPENIYLLIELNYYLAIVFPLKIIWIFPSDMCSIYIYIVPESDTRNSLSTQAIRETNFINFQKREKEKQVVPLGNAGASGPFWG